MPRTPINSEEKIIEIGDILAARFGREITATDIHKAFDGKGNFSRIRKVWENHLATKDVEQPEEFPLPDDVQEQIDRGISALEKSMQGMVQGLIARMTDQNVRQFALKERDFAMLETEHAKKVQALEEELTYLTECLDQYETEEEVTETEAPEPEQSATSKSAPAAAVLAEGRKFPNRPLKKTRPAPRKASRSKNPVPKKSPAPKPTAI